MARRVISHGRCGSRQSRGLSLIELMVVMAIIAILVSLLLPAVMFMQQASRRTACDNHLRQLALGLEMYVDVTRGVLPYPAEEQYPGGWAIAILPFIEEQPLADQFNYNWPVASPANEQPRRRRPTLFICPDTPERDSTMNDVGTTYYVLIVEPHPYMAERHRRNYSYYIKEAGEHMNFPWCLSPEVPRKDSGYEAPHPNAFNL